MYGIALTEKAGHMEDGHHAHVCSNVWQDGFRMTVDYTVDLGIHPKDFTMNETFCI